MALKIKPPQHRADAPGIYVPADDDAWDKARIEDEREKLSEGERHPVDKYNAGLTRFDMSVDNVAQYLDEGKRPFRVTLRRLSGTDYRRSQGVFESQGTSSGYHEACRIGVKAVENGPADFGKRGQLTPTEMDWLTRADGQDIEIGMAVMLYSQPLTEAEKKPSGS